MAKNVELEMENYTQRTDAAIEMGGYTQRTDVGIEIGKGKIIERESSTLEPIFDSKSGITQYKCPRCNQIWPTPFSNQKIKKPFNMNGIKAANNKIKQNCNPTDSQGNPRPLNLSNHDYPCRRLWVDTYLQNLKIPHTKGQAKTNPVGTCPNSEKYVAEANWLKVQYLYADEIKGVAGAVCIIENAENGKEILRKKLDDDGYLHVTDLPPEVNYVNVYFDDDPHKFQPFEDEEEILVQKFSSIKPKEKTSGTITYIDEYGVESTEHAPTIEEWKWIIHQSAIDFYNNPYNRRLLFGEFVHADLTTLEKIMEIIFNICLGILIGVTIGAVAAFALGKIQALRDLIGCIYQMVIFGRYDEVDVWFTLIICLLILTFPMYIGPLKKLGAWLKQWISYGYSKTSGAVFSFIKARAVTFKNLCAYLNNWGRVNAKKWIEWIIEQFDSKIPELINKIENSFSEIALKIKNYPKFKFIVDRATEAKRKTFDMLNSTWKKIKEFFDDVFASRERQRETVSTRSEVRISQPILDLSRLGLNPVLIQRLKSLPRNWKLIIRIGKRAAGAKMGGREFAAKTTDIHLFKGHYLDGRTHIPDYLSLNSSGHVSIDYRLLQVTGETADNAIAKLHEFEELLRKGYHYEEDIIRPVVGEIVPQELRDRLFKFIINPDGKWVISDIDIMGFYVKIGDRLYTRARDAGLLPQSLFYELRQKLSAFWRHITHGANDDQLLDLVNPREIFVPPANEKFLIVEAGEFVEVEGMKNLKAYYVEEGLESFWLQQYNRNVLP